MIHNNLLTPRPKKQKHLKKVQQINLGSIYNNPYLNRNQVKSAKESIPIKSARIDQGVNRVSHTLTKQPPRIKQNPNRPSYAPIKQSTRIKRSARIEQYKNRTPHTLPKQYTGIKRSSRIEQYNNRTPRVLIKQPVRNYNSNESVTNSIKKSKAKFKNPPLNSKTNSIDGFNTIKFNIKPKQKIPSEFNASLLQYSKKNAKYYTNLPPEDIYICSILTNGFNIKYY